MTYIISFEMDFTAELKIERSIWENRKLKFLSFLNLFHLKTFSLGCMNTMLTKLQC